MVLLREDVDESENESAVELEHMEEQALRIELEVEHMDMGAEGEPRSEPEED